MTEINSSSTDDSIDDDGADASVGPDASTDTRRNVMIVAGVTVALLLLGVGYLLVAVGRSDSDLSDREARARAVVEEFEENRPTPTRPPSATPTVEALAEAGPVAQPGEVVVVHRVPGDDYGRLAIRHIDGTRTLLNRRCLRVHIAADNGVCLSERDGIISAYKATFFDAADPRQTEIKSYDVALPSRVRVSPDGSKMSATAFASGSSYEDISSEATTFVIIDDFEVGTPVRSANQLRLNSTDDRYVNSPNRQYWGITFAPDNDQFYITGFFGGDPEILVGTLDDDIVEPTGWVGSCPSLSPDGETLVYKELRDDGEFNLVAVDLATDRTWQLGETRSVDDQVEWLDNDTILYALHPEGGDNPVQPEFDIWSLDIAEGAVPELFLPNADSPATIRG